MQQYIQLSSFHIVLSAVVQPTASKRDHTQYMYMWENTYKLLHTVQAAEVLMLECMQSYIMVPLRTCAVASAL